MLKGFFQSRLSTLKALFWITVIIGALVNPPLLMRGNEANAEKEEPTKEEALAVVEADLAEYKRLDLKPERTMTIKAERLKEALCKEGKEQHCPPKPATKIVAARKRVDPPSYKGKDAPYIAPIGDTLDIKKLAYAVSVAETSNCTTGTAISSNNCFGIMEFPNGKRRPKKFATKEESFAAFEDLWMRKYGGRFPTLADAQKYAGSEGSHWLHTVTTVYNRQQTATAMTTTAATATVE
jgi:hypothetical protein